MMTSVDRVRAVLAVLLVVSATATPAHAHVIGPRFVPIVEGTDPPVAGVRLFAAATGSMPRLTLRVSKGTLELTGALGEPFLRIGPDGLYVNEASRSAALLERPVEISRHASPADVRWTRRNRPTTVSWYEPRAEYPYDGPPETVRRRNTRATVFRWSLPATVDGRPVHLRGHVDWVPAPFDLSLLLLLASIAGSVLWIALGRRRRRLLDDNAA